MGESKLTGAIASAWAKVMSGRHLDGDERALLILSIKMAHNRNEQLENRVAYLEERIGELEARELGPV